jgi:hypothetical protein
MSNVDPIVSTAVEYVVSQYINAQERLTAKHTCCIKHNPIPVIADLVPSNDLLDIVRKFDYHVAKAMVTNIKKQKCITNDMRNRISTIVAMIDMNRQQLDFWHYPNGKIAYAKSYKTGISMYFDEDGRVIKDFNPGAFTYTYQYPDLHVEIYSSILGKYYLTEVVHPKAYHVIYTLGEIAGVILTTKETLTIIGSEPDTMEIPLTTDRILKIHYSIKHKTIMSIVTPENSTIAFARLYDDLYPSQALLPNGDSVEYSLMKEKDLDKKINNYPYVLIRHDGCIYEYDKHGVIMKLSFPNGCVRLYNDKGQLTKTIMYDIVDGTRKTTIKKTRNYQVFTLASTKPKKIDTKIEVAKETKEVEDCASVIKAKKDKFIAEVSTNTLINAHAKADDRLKKSLAKINLTKKDLFKMLDVKHLELTKEGAKSMCNEMKMPANDKNIASMSKIMDIVGKAIKI